MLVEVSPSSVTAVTGEPVVLLVTVVNTEEIISAHEVSVVGVDPSWVSVDEQRLSLFPGGAGVVTATITLPPGIPAGARKIAVQVREITAPATTEVIEVELLIPAQHGASIELDPPSIYGGSTATVAVLLRNEGNADLELAVAGADPDRAIQFRFEPAAVLLPPGEQVTVSTAMKARRPVTGSPKIRQYSVAATPIDGEPVSTTGTFLQKPFLSRGALGLAGLLAALAVFAAVIAISFSEVVESSQSDRDLVLEALREGEGGDGAAGTSSISGTVTLLTAGTPVPGVTAEIFSAADAGAPLANVATEGDGSYTFDGLAEGRYKLRFRGAGFVELWFPLSLTSDNAEEIELGPGQQLEGIDMRLGGVPASVEGVVSGEDPSGATVSVRLPAGTAAGTTGGTTPTTLAPPATQTEDPATSPVVATTVVDASGVFVVENLPSPSVYDVSVSLEGFAVETQRINLSAGEERAGLQFTLRRGDGAISGQVFGPDGPLGGVDVIASDGRTTIRSVTLTRDAVGSFTLRDVPTPAVYTISFSAPGHVTQTLTVALGLAERRSGLVANMATDAGSISGTVTLVGAGPTGGVRVRATSGETQVETVTLSSGAIGTYRLEGLAVPGTYTVTFERDDLESQTRSVTLDAAGRKSVTGIDATMNSATGTVFGTVFEQDPEEGQVPLGEVDVVLTSGERTFRTRTASEPTGSYEVRGLPPGTYSASFQRVGSQPAALLVTVQPGGRHQLDAVLSPAASIFGTVRIFNGVEEVPAVGAQVRLFRASTYPSNELAVVFADSAGRYLFEGLDAPEAYVVDFAPGPNQPVQQSRVVTVDPGEARQVEPVVLTTTTN